MNQAKTKLAFALDVPDKQAALSLVRQLEGSVGCFKVGLELFVREGPDILRIVRNNSTADIFLDLKLHDIPATMRGALRSAASLGARYVTVHASEGADALQAALKECDPGLEVLAVSVLTSQAEANLADLGYGNNATLKELVLHRTRWAQEAGCAGCVCSGLEAKAVRQQAGGGFKVVVPGIRPAWSASANDDQSRIVTPGQAIVDGADLIVVGRPIRDADDPRGAAEKIVAEIAQALTDKT